MALAVADASNLDTATASGNALSGTNHLSSQQKAPCDGFDPWVHVSGKGSCQDLRVHAAAAPVLDDDMSKNLGPHSCTRHFL